MSRSQSSDGGVIGVYGATGYTGGLVIRALLRRGYRLLVAARNQRALHALERSDGGLEAHAFSLNERDALAKFAASVDVIVNCAGPFGETAPPLAAAALAVGAHYVDVTGEPPVVLDLVERFHTAAQRAGLSMIPCAGFFGMLPDLLATAAARDWTQVDSIAIAYALEGWQMTQGSRAARDALNGRRHGFSAGALHIERGAPRFGAWTFPAPIGAAEVMYGYPSPEVVTLPRHLKTDEVRVLMTTRTLREVAATVAIDPRPDRADSRYLLQVELQRNAERRGGYLVGRDIYGISASLVAEIIPRLLSGAVKPGVLAAGDAFPAADVLHALPLDELKLGRGDVSSERGLEGRRALAL